MCRRCFHIVRIENGQPTHEVILYTMRSQWLRLKGYGGCARESLLAQRKLLDNVRISNAVPASGYQQQLGTRCHENVENPISRMMSMRK